MREEERETYGGSGVKGRTGRTGEGERTWMTGMGDSSPNISLKGTKTP